MPPLSDRVAEEPMITKKRKRPVFGNSVEEKINYHVNHLTDPEYNNTRRRFV